MATMAAPVPDGEHPQQSRHWLEDQEGSHLGAKHSLAAARAALKAEQEAHAITHELLRKQTANVQRDDEQVRALTEQIIGVRIALGKVAVYQGIMEYSPTVMAVDQLVRDHEELEARIDAVLYYIAADDVVIGDVAYNEIGRLLKGGKRVPDDLGEMDSDG